MGAHRLGQTGRIERGRGNVIAPLDRRPASDLAGGLNHPEGSKLGEAVFTRVAAVRSHPGDVVRDDATARLDAAMVLVEVDVDLVEVDVDLEALGWRGVEKGCDLAS